MFLSIATEGPGADRLSYIVQKMPGKVVERGSTRVFFPVYEAERANLVVMTEFPEFKLWNADTPDADAYVTSRDYALSSLFCRELKHALNTAISGVYKSEEDRLAAEKPREWIVEALPVVTSVPEKTIRDLLRPMGYSPLTAKLDGPGVEHGTYFVDHGYPYDWMPQKTRVIGLTLRAHKTLRQLLRELLVIIPVLDNYTHYSEPDPLVAELSKLGEGWLDKHPQREWIRARFLRYSHKLIRQFDSAVEGEAAGPRESELEKRIDLATFRVQWFVDKVKSISVARSVVDAGCGAGRLAEALLGAGVFEVSAFDCYPRAVETAMKYLKGKANVYMGSLLYRDERLVGKDVVCLQEVIEHMGPWQLEKSLDTLFAYARPRVVLMTTPNRDYNKTWGIEDGKFRHSDHKFEFNMREANEFVTRVAVKYGYDGSVEGVGTAYVPPPPRPDQEGAVAVAEPIAGLAPTFGFVFTRLDNARPSVGVK